MIATSKMSSASFQVMWDISKSRRIIVMVVRFVIAPGGRQEAAH
jgi:hypothetical protein